MYFTICLVTVGVLLAGGAVVSTAPTYLKCSNLFQLLQQTEHLSHFCFVGAVETTAPP